MSVSLAVCFCSGVEGAVVVGKLLERNAEPDYGYNAANNTYEDLVKAGIIDPLKVCFCLQLHCASAFTCDQGSV